MIRALIIATALLVPLSASAQQDMRLTYGPKPVWGPPPPSGGITYEGPFLPPIALPQDRAQSEIFRRIAACSRTNISRADRLRYCSSL